ncbi:hypothetical protein D3P08_12725 [Paenibacillus nanensis]|uniref:Spore protein YkvP/CgeB glycosyl transferase-like domain-containing protein n=1 Tax=Paenibacillus nanensis TaxID=393251 RepID=A0A3A1V198_9BACL|nr:glycosyltransferase family 4 protein [Paenibacillus nanensis]RIX52343.1 hypothetical protein D3P08_12725 [Paenibacillus nanensis]
MKVLHLPYNPAGQMSSQALALRKAGIEASFCSYGSNVFKYPTDIRSPIANQSTATGQKNAIRAFMTDAMERYDIFHFHGALTFSNSYQYSDLPLLADRKKIMNFWGSEVRRLSIAKRSNPYNRVKHTDEAAIVKRLKLLSKHFQHVIVPDYEIYEYVKDFFPNIHTVRYVVDHERIAPVYPDPAKPRPLVVHAPSDPYLKGTEFVLRAVENLHSKIDFDFEFIQKMPHEKALRRYAQADIIVDQLCIGVYSILSIESMLMGKPVITYIRPDLQEHYPSDLPIVSASPDTIESTLQDLLLNPERRRELGMKGREYAMKYHAPEVIAQRLIDVYNQL